MLYYKDSEGNLIGLPMKPETTQEQVLDTLNYQDALKRDAVKLGLPAPATAILAVL